MARNNALKYQRAVQQVKKLWFEALDKKESMGAHWGYKHQLDGIKLVIEMELSGMYKNNKSDTEDLNFLRSEIQVYQTAMIERALQVNELPVEVPEEDALDVSCETTLEVSLECDDLGTLYTVSAGRRKRTHLYKDSHVFCGQTTDFDLDSVKAIDDISAVECGNCRKKWAGSR